MIPFSTHRRFATLAVVTGVLTVTACGGGSDIGDDAVALDPGADLSQQSIVVSNWADYMPSDMADKFKAETGASMKVTNHATNEDLVAKVAAAGGSGLDVIFASQPYLEQFAEQGLLEPLDPNYVKNLGNLDDQAAKVADSKGTTYWAPYTWGTTGICYRSDLVDKVPTSWNDLLSPSAANKGKVTMMATPRWAMLPAQKSLGQSVNSKDEPELKKAKDVLIKAKSGLLAYDDTTFYTRLVSGEATMVQAWDGWCNYGITDNDKIDFVVPEEGSDLWIDGMAVLKTSKNKEAAESFINLILEPENHAWVEENILYNIPNEAARKLVPTEITDQYPLLGSRREETLKGENMTNIGEAESVLNQLVAEVTAS